MKGSRHGSHIDPQTLVFCGVVVLLAGKRSNVLHVPIRLCNITAWLHLAMRLAYNSSSSRKQDSPSGAMDLSRGLDQQAEE